MTDLVKLLRDEDSYYRLQEKHWCIDAEELERQRLVAADRIEALGAENERLRDIPNRIWAEARDSEWDEGFNYAVKLFRAALGETK